MQPTAERVLPSWDFALPTEERPRALWAQAQHALKRFVLGAPEDALLAMASTDHVGTHVGAFALLTLPLCFAWSPSGAIGRWTILFSVIAGLLVAVRLESARHSRANPLGALSGALAYSVALSGVAWKLLGPAALRVDPSHLLAAFAAGAALLATRNDARLCALASIVGVLSLTGLLVSSGAPTATAAPVLISGGAIGFAGTLAAARGQQLRRLAILDATSGALHCAAFERCLDAAHQQAHGAAEPMMLARIEFTALPAIREAHGAVFANALMRWLASALVNRFRATDLLGRTGDDELSLALQGTDHPGVERRLAQLCEEFDTIELSRGGLREPIALRVTYGVAAFPREADAAAAAQALAGQRLALAKWRARRAA